MIDWISDLSSAGGLEAILARIPGGVTEESNDLSLFHWPYDIVRHHKTHFGETLLAISRGLGADESYQQLGEKIVAAKDAIIGKHAVLDTSRGPIVLMKGAEIGPLSFLRGPVMIGPDARVNDHASVKDGVMLGQTARVGGELHNSIVEPFSNKQHHGFLGDSYVGAWVNLGAGTTNSNLKNTYGTIRVTYHAKETGAHKFNLPNDEYVETKVDTGMQFLGVVIGDYSKTAINTNLYTGLTIGACSNLYGTITQNVPSFVNHVAYSQSVTEVPAEVAITTHERMHARRNSRLHECDRELVREAHRLTNWERAAVEPGLPKF